MEENNISSADKIGDNIDSPKKDIDTRAYESFWNLIWKTFYKWDKVPLIYKTPDWRIINYKLDTITNQIIIDDRLFSVKPLEWTVIDKIKFMDDKFIIYWKIWIIDWKIESTYIKTIKAIDEIYSYISKNK